MKQFMRKFMVYGIWFMVFLLSTVYYLPSTIFAAGATLSLNPASGTQNAACTFSVDIVLDTGGAKTDGTDAILFYDNSRLSATAIKSGTIYSDYPGNNIDSQNGKIAVSGMTSPSASFTGSGTLATIDFQVASGAPAGATQITFDFDPNNKGKTTDSNVVERSGDTVSDILNQVVNGSYTIGTGTSCSALGPTPGGGIPGGKTPVIGPGGKTPVGGPEITKTPVLPTSADVNPTLILTVSGALLTILGMIGLALL